MFPRSLAPDPARQLVLNMECEAWFEAWPQTPNLRHVILLSDVVTSVERFVWLCPGSQNHLSLEELSG